MYTDINNILWKLEHQSKKEVKIVKLLKEKEKYLLLIKKIQGLNKDKVKIMRIAGIDIPDNKRGEVALTYIFGIGRSSSKKILKSASIDFDKKIGSWTEEESNIVRKLISDEYTIEGDLKSEVQLSIKRLMDIGSYRGLRHRKGLPVRGQKTKNNSRTRKGKRKTVANKKKLTK